MLNARATIMPSLKSTGHSDVPRLLNFENPSIRN